MGRGNGLQTARAVSSNPGGRPKLLLINPRFGESFWSFRWSLERILPGKRAINPPLGLATLAALCPAHWDVTIVDENVETIPLAPQADIIGVCGMAAQFDRQEELLRYYRERGYYVVAGGSHASLCPERFEPLADSVVAGEAEYIWPAFCADFERSDPQPLYRETGVVKLTDSPPPRYDLLRLEQYTTVSLQFSRGCPYRCEFCDIIVMFGRRPRTKTPEQVGRELDLLRERGVRSVFFVDDNLIGNKKAAGALLEFLADYQRRHRYTFNFGTEVSINLAEDEALLELFRAANFTWVFIGIESADPDSLKETRKTQNLRQDPLQAVRAIYRHGIDILAGFIVGFDNDTVDSFDAQSRFIEAAGIQVAMVGLLTALPHTPLYERLEREHRLLPAAAHGDNTKPWTNFVPARMSYDVMVDHYQRLYRALFTDAAIAGRIRNKMRELRQPNYTSEYRLRDRVTIAARFATHGLLPGGPRRLARFLGTLRTVRPGGWPQVLIDWIAGLSMADYVQRHFTGDDERTRRLAERAASALRRRWAQAMGAGHLRITTRLAQGRAELHLLLNGPMERAFYRATGYRLRRLLRRSGATVTLALNSFCAEQADYVQQLLDALAPYGTRVSVWIDDHVRARLAVDSSTFHLMLNEPLADPRP